MKATVIAMLIPADVRLKIPNDKPSGPNSLATSIAPCINRCPNDVIGIIAPAPTYNTILSYIPNMSRAAPITTNNEVTCPGVNLVLSNINWAIIQTKPQNKNEYKKIIIQSPPNL